MKLAAITVAASLFLACSPPASVTSVDGLEGGALKSGLTAPALDTPSLHATEATFGSATTTSLGSQSLTTETCTLGDASAVSLHVDAEVQAASVTAGDASFDTTTTGTLTATSLTSGTSSLGIATAQSLDVTAALHADVIAATTSLTAPALDADTVTTTRVLVPTARPTALPVSAFGEFVGVEPMQTIISGVPSGFSRGYSAGLGNCGALAPPARVCTAAEVLHAIQDGVADPDAFDGASFNTFSASLAGVDVGSGKNIFMDDCAGWAYAQAADQTVVHARQVLRVQTLAGNVKSLFVATSTDCAEPPNFNVLCCR